MRKSLLKGTHSGQSSRPAATGHSSSIQSLTYHDLDCFTSDQQERFHSLLKVRTKLFGAHQRLTDLEVKRALATVQLIAPPHSPVVVIKEGVTCHLIDQDKQHVYSEFLRRAKMDLSTFVHLLRGESKLDSRPNKALCIPSHLPFWNEFPYRRQWAAIVANGVRPVWSKQFPRQRTPPDNHSSVTQALNSLIKNIRKDQDDVRYLVLDMDLLHQLDGITCSPFGAVKKGNGDIAIEARMIHDLSYPPGDSVNNYSTEKMDMEVTYDGARAIASRILDVATQHPGSQMMMAGDVDGAFRNILIHADHVGRFAGVIRELGILIIDLACPFGSSESPASYWVAGAAIKFMHAHTRPTCSLLSGQPASSSQTFDSKAWCDDHVCGTRCGLSTI